MIDLDQVSIRQIKQGFRYDQSDGLYQCLYCLARFEEGLVYAQEGQFMTAARAMASHVSSAHGSPFEQILTLEKRFIGLTDHQKYLIRLMREGKTYQEIASITGTAASTIRAQRFLFKEKGRQAKLLLALLELLDENSGRASSQLEEDPDAMTPIHATAAQIDERFAITASEKDKVIKTYVESADPLVIKSFPVKEKRKLILLDLIARRFAPDRVYTEKEVNEIIRPIFHDFATIRRYLIEYGYLDRTSNGSSYWVKGGVARPAAAAEVPAGETEEN